ncbi:efflux RND transporter periplasmic adaptor subunit [Myxococcota bacterium]|nr:efflux RND transporter periplasmic adaptor subunit [Myxococcota bacterium]MBU1380360.1 efflux RND transporter periplasmic adaptor subunit [Myxococcota bacterium]MBU1498200.1 efflux RND transporter periplasmic adaptor subunit [Myxococcota bacterium]
MKTHLNLLLAALFLVSCSSGKKSVKSEEPKSSVLKMTPEKLKFTKPEFAVAGPGVLNITWNAQGEIAQSSEAVFRIVPKVGGIVREFKVKEGQTIKKGDVIALIDSREVADLKLKYLEGVAKGGQAWAKTQREKDLFEKKIVAQDNYITAKTAFERQNIETEMVKQRLLLTGMTESELKNLLKTKENISVYTLKSNLDGVVTKRHASVGDAVSSEKELLSVADFSTVRFEVRVNPGVVDNIKPQDNVKLYNGKLNETIEGTVDFISPVIDRASRTILVRVSMKNPGGRWRPGLCGLATFTVKKIPVKIAVPLGAITDIAGSPVVFVEKSPGMIEMRKIITGTDDGKIMEIKQGLQKGDRVVTANTLLIKAEWLKVMGE